MTAVNNSAFNISQQNFTDVSVFYIASGVLHILLVVVPVLVFGPIVLGVFISNKELRDPVSILYICTATLCVIGPLTYGLLLDCSLITTVEFFGSCESQTSKIFWVLFGTFQTQLLASNALLSLVQYISAKWGSKKISTRVVVGIFFTMFVVSLLANMIHFIGSSEEHIRGSLCRHPGAAIPYAYPFITMFTLGVLTIPPFVLVVVFSILTIVYVKKKTVQNSHVIKTVVKIVLIWTAAVMLCRSLPILVVFLGFDTASTPISVILVRSWYGIYSVELSYPLFVLLPMFLHKTVGKILKKKFKSIYAQYNLSRVSPSGSSI
ncbi:uncharacterized protein LOC135351073 [Halichondria panicea]|uniref:uncharacterized protein LOC135351073 n=1 Tax=Halichondria panicea TaxID=6063 RepID=UPI00312BAE04